MTAETAPLSTPSSTELDALRSAVAADLAAYLEDLGELVNIDCGSYTPSGVDEVGRFVTAFLRELGATVEARPDPEGKFGSTIIGHLHLPLTAEIGLHKFEQLLRTAER